MTPQLQKERKSLRLREALDIRTVDVLKELLNLISVERKPTRKVELIDEIAGALLGPKLRSIYNQLDDMKKYAISEAVHSDIPVFDARLLKAKYGDVPEFTTKSEDGWSYRGNPTALQLFFYSESSYGSYGKYIPDDLKSALKSIVRKPEQVSIFALDEIPEQIKLSKDDYRFRYYESGEMPIVRRDCELSALQELPAILRLIDKGKISVSDKTSHPTAASINRITEILREGDYYEKGTKDSESDEIGAIKSFAWSMLIQAAKLAELQDKKFVLTKAGRNALGMPVHETVKLIWERWLKSELLDELNRVSNIKGQFGKKKGGFTPLSYRRNVIADALRYCPIYKWVSIEELYRFMQATNLDIAVTSDPWELYILDSYYGRLDDGNSDVLSQAYLLTTLFEYVSTLGMINVAYVRPEGAKDYYHDTWGGDGLSSLTRYDGLLYCRLTPLGAWCLGLSDSYSPYRIESKTSLTVLPSMQINVNGELTIDESMLLDTWAIKETEKAWRLNREKSLEAIERGNNIKELNDFLQNRDEQILPETVESFIISTEKNSRALKNSGRVLLIECENRLLADTIAGNPQMKNLCMRAGDRHLAVKMSYEEKFRKILHMLGYGMPYV